MTKKMSRAVELKCGSGGKFIARRVPPGVDDQFCQCWIGAVKLKPGDWIVEMPGGDLPMSDEQIRAVFQPRDESLLTRWNNVQR